MPIAKRIRKQASGVEVTGDRTVQFVLSTGAVDRDRDTIDPRGWDVSDYSGVVLFGHDSQRPPVARGRAWVEGDRLLGEATFPPDGVSPFADEVFNLIKAGVLTDCSVGFQPTVPPEDNGQGGLHFGGARLLEWSIVSIGSNRDARVLSRALGERELMVLKHWTRNATEPPASPMGIEPAFAAYCVNCGAGMDNDSWRFCPSCGNPRARVGGPPTSATTGTKAWEDWLAAERKREEAEAWKSVTITSEDWAAIFKEATAAVLPDLQRAVMCELTGQID